MSDYKYGLKPTTKFKKDYKLAKKRGLDIMWCPKSGNLGKGRVHFMGYSLSTDSLVNCEKQIIRAARNAAAKLERVE